MQYELNGDTDLSLKLISLNVESSRHLERVLPFLTHEMPDVATIQELNEKDIAAFARALGGATCHFVPMERQLRDDVISIIGVGIFSRLPVIWKDTHYYSGDPASIPEATHGKPETYNHCNRFILTCDVEKDGAIFRISTTHFTWSFDGKALELQRQHMSELLKIVGKFGEFILTGDFNTPRVLHGQSGEIFNMLAGKYKDNVPAKYTTSIDARFHRAGALSLMVDGLFSTPGFEVSGVEMICGLSDHCALKAIVRKRD